MTSKSVLPESRSWPVPAGRITTSPALRFSARPFAPPNRTRACPREAQHFMNPRMVMRVIVNAIPPGIAPAIALEKLFEHSRRVEFARKPDGAPIEHEGQLWIVRNDAVVLEPESICFPWPQGRIEITERRAGTRDLFEPLLNDFQNGHDCTRARL